MSYDERNREIIKTTLRCLTASPEVLPVEVHAVARFLVAHDDDGADLRADELDLVDFGMDGAGVPVDDKIAILQELDRQFG